MDKTSLVVVAIPSQDDHVWKVSSEKVPHLTILYLGEQEVGPETAQMAEFIEHAADVSLNRFGLSVDRRGELGDDKADVLFFDGYFLRELKEFRSNLLKNEAISKAYHSADQYPSWTPHLTLGYPETPAKPDDREYGIDYVRFDRIALWTGDSEGFVVPLKDEYADKEMAMSDRVGDFLSHYGIKGMKWGVRRTQAQIEAASEDAAKAEALKSRAKTSGTNALSNSELRTAIDRMNLETQYARLAEQTTPKSKGRKFAESLLGDIAKQEVSRVGKAAVSLRVEKELVDRGHKDLAARIKPKKK